MVDAISYGNDDWALLASTMLAVGQYIAVLVGLSEGLGKSQTLLSVEQISSIEKSTTAQIFMYFLSHCLSKVSTALLTLRLFENGRSRNAKLSWALVLLSTLYGLGTILAASIDCSNPTFPQPGDTTCPNRILRFQIVLALDVITEALLVIVPLALVLNILTMRSSKITVTAIFAFRLMDIVFAALNLHQIELLRHSDDYGTSIVPPTIWTQAELLWSILAASLPCLKSFMRPFEKVDEDTWRSGQGYSSSRSGLSRGTRRTQSYGDALQLDYMSSHRQTDSHTMESTENDDKRESHRLGEENNATITNSLSRTSAFEDERRSWGSQDRIVQVSRLWPTQNPGSGKGPFELA
ncbi:hypothetical protein Slin15195_G060970 [Septoria linicola]|uniref:Rhodopsin domain-containing protein n=1 Tax=Septoria linicola TaxID=215465 RepID=A0A9Q9AT99_9PEZI|nr:hypothetical protein Slin14017_G076780 [Septoria linicola]USW52778.1 hypothetical protein Slin15195_G060970 [Septoria linicola]